MDIKKLLEIKFKDIEYKRYSVKEAIAYYKLAYEEMVRSKLEFNINNFELALRYVIIQNPHQFDVIEIARCKNIGECEFYWILTVDQVITIGKFLFDNMMKQNNDILNQKLFDLELIIISNLNILLRLYSIYNIEQILRMKEKEKLY